MAKVLPQRTPLPIELDLQGSRLVVVCEWDDFRNQEYPPIDERLVVIVFVPPVPVLLLFSSIALL
jgi:hypothetical protein